MIFPSNDYSFELNDFVFSKLKGYPWWPGQIIKIEKNGKKIVYHCADSYSNTISKISDIKNIVKFEDNIDYILNNTKGKKHLDAISMAIETLFEGKKMPKKYKKILEDIKNGNYSGENTPLNSTEKKKSEEIDSKEKKKKKTLSEKKEEKSSNKDSNNISIDESKEKENETKKIKSKEVKNVKDSNNIDKDYERIDYLLNKKRKHETYNDNMNSNSKSNKSVDSKNKKIEKKKENNYQVLETKKEEEEKVKIKNKENEKKKEKEKIKEIKDSKEKKTKTEKNDNSKDNNIKMTQEEIKNQKEEKQKDKDKENKLKAKNKDNKKEEKTIEIIKEIIDVNDKKEEEKEIDESNKMDIEKNYKNINKLKMEGYNKDKIIKEKEKETKIEKDEEEGSYESISINSSNLAENDKIKKYKNYDFYQIVKYLKRIALVLDKSLKEGKNPYFSIEEKKDFICLMDYLNNIEISDTIKFLKMTNIGNYINYINQNSNIKEFKDATKKFIENSSQKISLQLFVEKMIINDLNI